MGSLKILCYIIVIIFRGNSYIKNPGPLYPVKALPRLYLRKSWIGDQHWKMNPRPADRVHSDSRFLQTEPSRRTFVFPCSGQRVPRHAQYYPVYGMHIRSLPYDCLLYTSDAADEE